MSLFARHVTRVPSAFSSRRCFGSKVTTTASAASRLSQINASELREVIGRNKRAFIVYDETRNQFETSNLEFAQLLEAFNVNQDAISCIDEDQALQRDWDKHEGLFLEIGKDTNAIHGAFVHKTKRGAAAGGVRYWTYENLSQYLCDGLRLSRGMGRKNALAGLHWGGGKGVIWREEEHPYTDRCFRDTLFKEYGEFITSLQGCYVTAEDLGVTVEDMRQVFSTTRFSTCVPQELGGSGNPSIKTGHGIVAAMEGALAYHDDSLHGKTISIQGFGNVSQAMVRHLFEYHQKYQIRSIYATDINREVLSVADQIRNQEFAGVDIDLKVDIVPFGDNTALLREDVDIVSPCAVGGTLNADTIPRIKAKYVVGAANNQLLDDVADDQRLCDYERFYVPDFLANRMGIVNCSNEQYGRIEEDDAILRHLGKSYENSIYMMVHKVFGRSEQDNIPTGQAANVIADELMTHTHPIWGHRPWHIIQSLVKQEWHKRK
mmetsp:Transcript_31424/g.50899  ORF Transcript_31424/g.50899 Transcript_31424/m.50899 type:complete len:490 (+) Transcript_31424:24-1493(+)